MSEGSRGNNKDIQFNTTPYDYDKNGNQTSNLDKQISGISYNHLNLPEEVTFAENTGRGQREAFGARELPGTGEPGLLCILRGKGEIADRPAGIQRCHHALGRTERDHGLQYDRPIDKGPPAKGGPGGLYDECII